MASALPTFDVDAGVLYQIHGVNGAQGQLSEIDLIESTFANIGDKAGFKINGTGFRASDGYIYGIKMDKDELIRLGSDGGNEVLGAIQGLPNGSYFTGDFGADGLLYVRHRNVFYGVDVDSVSVERTLTADSNIKNTYDITYNPETGLHYSIRKSGRRAEFISIDLNSDDDIARVNVINDDLKPAGTYGGLFGDASGRIFAANNAGGLYEVDLETGVATFAGYSPKASSNDGAFSPQAFLNLPPVAVDAWMTVLPEFESHEMPIESPYDLEGTELQITVTSVPEFGSVVDTSGDVVQVGQQMTVGALTALVYQTDGETDANTPTQRMQYQVSDGFHEITSEVEIDFAGKSRIRGQVNILDDSEESSYDGYAYQVEIELSGTDLLGNTVTQSVFTDVNGWYDFSEVLPGTYSIRQIQPPTVFDAFQVANDLEGNDGPNQFTDFTIGNSPSSIRGVDFYEYAPASLSGFVYVDNNRNGMIDVSESGIREVTLNLIGEDVDGNSVALSTTSDSYGFYEFVGLVPGTYDVSQVQPSGYIDALVNVGYQGGTGGENSIGGVELGSGQIGLNYHFGEYESGSLRGNVFIDNDLDNVFDNGDTPLDQVVIQLNGTDIDGNWVELETRTDSEGAFSFEELMAGTYEIVELQPDGLENGRSLVGIFNNDEDVLDSNGVAEANRIRDIEVGFGRHGRSFNFSEAVDYRFTNDFSQYSVFEGTEGDDIIRFFPGDSYHRVHINGVDHFIDAAPNSSIRVDGLGGSDRFVINGSENVEQVFTWEDLAVMRSRTWRFAAFSGESFVVDSGGGYDRAFMYDTSGDDRVKMTQDYTRLWSGDYFAETRGFHRSYAYAENGGNDRAYLYDSKYDDTVKLTSSNARMISRKFYSFSKGFERVYAYSQNGGQDRAQFWDSVNDNDVLQATPEYSRMYNEGFYNIAVNFYQVDAFGYGGGQNDQAHLIGSAEQETLIASPTKSGMAGLDFKFDVHGFERTYAFSKGGNDRALLFDSKLDDRFVSLPNSARMYNDQFYLIARDFSRVDGFSSRGGNDRAYFYDSQGDDVLITHENKTRMFGEGYDNNSHGFARTYAHSTNGGEDLAFIYDTDQADTIKTDSQIAKIYGATYYSWMNQFEEVHAKFASSSRHDRALVFGAINEESLAISGDQAHLIYDHAAEFIYDVDEHDEDEFDESDLNSIYEDLIEFFGGNF